MAIVTTEKPSITLFNEPDEQRVTVTIAENAAATDGRETKTWHGCTVDYVQEIGNVPTITFTDSWGNRHFIFGGAFHITCEAQA